MRSAESFKISLQSRHQANFISTVRVNYQGTDADLLFASLNIMITKKKEIEYKIKYINTQI